MSCQVTHNQACEGCTKEECFRCVPDWTLWNGTCYDCSKIPNSETCDKVEAKSCKKGYYMTKENGKNVCLPCTLLENCLECSDANTCTVCSKDFFGIKNGKCDCTLGANSVFLKDGGTANYRCECLPGYY